MRRGLLATALLSALAAPAPAAELIPGPINAHVVSVYDGDTFTADAIPWPGITIRTSVRVDGVDTPEIRGECQAEKDMAIEAREFAEAALGESVLLADVRQGKYAGRVVARVLAGEQDLATMLVEAGLGRVYHGGTREGGMSRSMLKM